MPLNLENFKQDLVRQTSSFTREQGKDLAKKSCVKNLKGKNIKGIYHVYGSVLNDEKNRFYDTHIKIDFKSGHIIGENCGCETFKENSRHIKNYMCKHIFSTGQIFYSLLKKKEKKREKKEEALIKTQKIEENREEKRFLSLDISIKHTIREGIPLYNCEFRIGVKNLSLILDLKDFLYKNTLKRNLKFNEVFTYNPLKDEFLEKDKKILRFLVDNKSLIKGRYLSLKQNRLKDFLMVIDEKKKVNFNFNSINYEVKVKKENIPVALTLKERKEGFILSHHKRFPILLNPLGDVMLFDRNLYLPRKKQREYYIPLYKRFLKNNSITYKKNLENLKMLLEELKNVSPNIILDENVKHFKEKLMKTTFSFYEKNNFIYCNVIIDYCGYIVDLIKDYKDKSFLRDLKREKNIEFHLERLKFIKREQDFKFIGEEEDFFKFLSKGIHNLKSLGEVLFLGNLKGYRSLNSSNMFSELVDFNNFYKLKLDFEDFTLEEIKESIVSMKRGESFYKKGKVYLDLEDPKIVTFFNFLEDLGLENIKDDEIKIDKSKALYIQERLKDRNLSFIKGGELILGIVDRLLKKDFKRKLVPKALKAELRPYQKEGFKWLNEITDLGFGGILADDMGLGKTIQIIAFLLSQKKSKSLIVVPTSVIYNWMDEFERFAPSIRVGLVHGSREKRERVLRDFKRGLSIKEEENNKRGGSYEKYDVLISSYGTLKNDEKAYEDLNFDYFIIDEAQSIKNPKAKVSLAVKSIKSRCNIALTGTPIENNLIELWSIFDFIMPGYLFTKERFRERFILDEKNLGELKSLISPFILRRLKEEVLNELPEKINKKYLVEIKGKQKQIYNSYLKLIKGEIRENKSSKGKGKNEINLLAHLTKLREICLDPSLVFKDYKEVSSKIALVEERVKEYGALGKKVLLFSQFTSVLKKLEKNFKKEGISYLYLDGETSAKERIERVNSFNKEKDIQVFLISLKAGGVGLNLTSASVVIHFDPWWNPAVEDQATDRAHRFGQKNKVEVIKLVAKDTIEEKIDLIKEDKRELIGSLMEGEGMKGKALKTLTEEEILRLFE